MLDLPTRPSASRSPNRSPASAMQSNGRQRSATALGSGLRCRAALARATTRRCIATRPAHGGSKLPMLNVPRKVRAREGPKLWLTIDDGFAGHRLATANRRPATSDSWALLPLDRARLSQYAAFAGSAPTTGVRPLRPGVHAAALRPRTWRWTRCWRRPSARARRRKLAGLLPASCRRPGLPPRVAGRAPGPARRAWRGASACRQTLPPMVNQLRAARPGLVAPSARTPPGHRLTPPAAVVTISSGGLLRRQEDDSSPDCEALPCPHRGQRPSCNPLSPAPVIELAAGARPCTSRRSEAGCSLQPTTGRASGSRCALRLSAGRLRADGGHHQEGERRRAHRTRFRRTPLQMPGSTCSSTCRRNHQVEAGAGSAQVLRKRAGHVPADL